MVGKPLSVVPKKDHIIYLSQVCLGEAAGDDQGAVCVETGEQKIVLGNLSSEKIPQMPVDLVFKNEFVLAHNIKNKKSNSDDMYDSSERENSEFAEYFRDFHNLREIRKERNIPGKNDKSSDDHLNRFWQYGILKRDQSAGSHDSFFMDDGDEDANM
ncbi:histone deacetylase HDT1-like [Pyrus ussuriensis x Pyrus communis]|uniref:Histone deacetylase HDT1-like n=1 Tax=Pyrus ussuriensis x Pyrus communis TaxID=2448454 RepID=A0A5N5HMX7_9ROSA|nr:histone deacetylase HDT1-like [Pyrus ussuriensis x Pyrus communis]